MRTFEDATGTEWDVNITLLTEADIHDAAGVYLSDLSPERNILEDLSINPVLFGKVLSVICSKQLQGRDMSSKELLGNLHGEFLDNARDAVIEATFDFLGRRGETLREMWTQQARVNEEMEKAGMENLRNMTGEEMAQVMLNANEMVSRLDEITDMDGKLEDILESIPEDLLSDS